jgi:negative regulator of sigma E activity
LFNEKGKFVYTIDYSSEKILPAYIKTMVMKAYKKYEIISVAKILEANRKIWVIKLDSKNDIATVRVEDGEMEEVGFFQKSH